MRQGGSGQSQKASSQGQNASATAPNHGQTSTTAQPTQGQRPSATASGRTSTTAQPVPQQLGSGTGPSTRNKLKKPAPPSEPNNPQPHAQSSGLTRAKAPEAGDSSGREEKKLSTRAAVNSSDGLPTLESFQSCNYFLRIPQEHNGYIVFMLLGNPGYIGWYGDFLMNLSNCDKCPGTKSCVIAGSCHAGFEEPNNNTQQKSSLESVLLGSIDMEHRYTLDEQMRLALQRLRTLVMLLRIRYYHQDWKVILIGHSAGAYIALEMLQLIHEEEAVAERSNVPRNEQLRESIPHALLIAPTIVDLSNDRVGWLGNMINTITKPVYTNIVEPAYNMVAYNRVAELMMEWLFPQKTPAGGMDDESENAAKDAATSAAKKLTVKGCKQSTLMAHQELANIKNDKWGDNIWNGPTKLTFSFARADPFVSGRTKDRLVKEKIRDGNCEELDMSEGTDGFNLMHLWPVWQSAQVGLHVQNWIRLSVSG